jgi:hypothetical protein
MEEHTMYFVGAKLTAYRDKCENSFFLYRISDSDYVNFLVICKKNELF